MKESESIKDYSDKLLSIVNKIRLLGKDFSDERIVQKILVTLPENNIGQSRNTTIFQNQASTPDHIANSFMRLAKEFLIASSNNWP